MVLLHAKGVHNVMELTMNRTKITDVAIYLRKSRDESDGMEDVLAKHESRLLEYADRNEFNVLHIYREIGTSQYIDARTEMQRLLQGVSRGLYDAVLVMDLDRLSRGDMYEFGRIQRAFAESSTLVVTPQKVIDFNDESQEIVVGVEHLVGRQEYKQIRKRMVIGKQEGAKMGNWTNGKPPFPYIYDRNTRNIVVDESKREIYNLMKKWLLEDDMPCYKISTTLNKMGVPSPGGSTWSENAVYRVLTSEVHMGIIVYGKTSGSGHKNKFTKPLTVKDKVEWIVNRDCKHEIIKTEAEHDQIMSRLARKRIQPKEPRKRNFYPLTGLLFCGKCKRSMQFMNKAGRRLMVKTCQTHDPFGNRCYNQASYVDVVYHELQGRLVEYEQQIRQQTPQQPQADTSTLEIARNNKHDEMKELNKALERNEDMFLRGKFDEV